MKQIVVMQVKMLNDMWIPIREEDAQKMICLLDTDHKSSVDYHDFREFVYMLPEDQVRGLSTGKRAPGSDPHCHSQADH
jgi:hypothetical protein